MIVINEISVTGGEGTLSEPRGILSVVHNEPVDGVHLKIMLGSAGLFIRRGNQCVAFPLAGLIDAAVTQCPELTAVG